NTSSDMIENAEPKGFALAQNYPNPFNPSTKIQFSLQSDAMVSVKVFNLLGQEVATMLDQEMTAGVNTLTFDGSALGSGIYFYRMAVNDPATGKLLFTNVKRMLLVK